MESSVGAQLKQIRESQGIALETIALKTHIALAYLQALEADDVEALPSKVHVRGFLRLYANELGVELDDLTVSSYHLADEKQPPYQIETSALTQDDQLTEDVEPEKSLAHVTRTDTEPEPEAEQDLSAKPLPPETLDEEPGAVPSEPGESAHVFKDIGAKIKKRRELLSLSVTEVHNNLHIQPQHLLSIEAGQFDQLPSPVQAKGMLVNYADFLNLDTTSLLSDYTDALQLQRIEKQNTLSTRKRRSARELSPAALRLKNFFTLDLLVITVLFIAFAAFVVWGVNRILASDPPELAENEIPGVADILLATDTPTPQLTTDAEATLIVQDEDNDTETAQEEPLFTPVFSIDPINLLLIPRQRVWAQVTVDGELVFQGRLIPGNAYDFSGQDRIDILTGNVGSLQILFNNQDIGSQGLLGQVAELSFTANGLILPPPTSTPTITNTPQTTPTPTESDDQNN